MNEIYIKRLKSFAWRLGAVILAAALDYTARNLGLFDLPDEMTIVLGLILGEVSKFLNTATK